MVKLGSSIILCFSVITAQETSEVHISPKKFQDDKKFMDFTCSAILNTAELLCWYQIKGSETILLNITQRSENRSAWTSIQLKKTLEPSDNATEVFCKRQTVLPNRTFSDGQESQRIPIVFQKDITPLETPYVTIEPNEQTIYFDVNRTLYLNCTGSKPVDGRSYTWFLINSESKLTVPEQQSYNASTNINPLKLPLDESHHRNQLFCAQDWHLYIDYTDGPSRRKKYGELARSSTITLVQRGREVEPSQIIAIVVPLVLVAVAAVIVAVLWRRRGRERCTTVKDEDFYACTYATGQVTYAALSLPNSATRMPKKPDTNYASIVGVVIPNKGHILQ